MGQVSHGSCLMAKPEQKETCSHLGLVSRIRLSWFLWCEYSRREITLADKLTSVHWYTNDKVLVPEKVSQKEVDLPGNLWLVASGVLGDSSSCNFYLFWNTAYLEVFLWWPSNLWEALHSKIQLSECSKIQLQVVELILLNSLFKIVSSVKCINT